MPHRLISVAILLGWAVAAGALIRRDLLPLVLIGPPPDMRSIGRAEDRGPVVWSILIVDGQASSSGFRTIGDVVTKTRKVRDGFVELAADAKIDSAAFLKGNLSVGGEAADQLLIHSAFDIDPSGNLYQFEVVIRWRREPKELMIIEGKVRHDQVVVHARSPLMPMFNWNKAFPYQAHGMVQNTLAPIDRMPGLHVGQRWESKIVSPLTFANQMETVKVEVPRYRTIQWGNDPVRVFEVVSRFSTLTARTWVRPDGLVLRQEIPTLHRNLFLERRPPRTEPEETTRP